MVDFVPYNAPAAPTLLRRHREADALRPLGGGAARSDTSQRLFSRDVMHLDSARDLKQTLADIVLAPLTAGGPSVKKFSLPTGPISAVPAVLPSIALGIAPHKPGDFRLAVRCQRPELMDSPEVKQIRKKAKDEVDV